MNSVDKLFKSKLDDHQLAPGPKAWEKLERNLSKKNNAVIWLRVAAVLALAGVLTFALLRWNLTESPETLTKVNEPVEQKQTPENKTSEPDLTAVPLKKIETPKVATKKPSIKKALQSENLVAQAEQPVTAPTEMPESAVETPQEVTLPVQPSEKKAIVIVYSLPTRTTKESAEPVVAATEDEQKGIQKIWEAAKEVKNSDNPWGDLREAKNELFALEFRKDKNRNQ